ncbi:hypothetical protein FHS92_001087 [Sphingobium subterraneum]|uniref:Uncharacterized protein n=2 Tax=Sphingobium subterraneum TaxID=627688 RepID=A0A841IYI4_9SPHN|nr:hypothetical protein [Sphingobium subterraneum]
MTVKQATGTPPIVWGHCIVHLSHPQFSGNVLHTSSVLNIVEYETFKIVETRNHYYILLGPEVEMPVHSTLSPSSYLRQQQEQSPRLDAYASAAVNADRDCPKCDGSGVYRRDNHRLAICDICCKHNQSWWQLEGDYGADTGRWACGAGCGAIVDTPPPELEFLPRARG